MFDESSAEIMSPSKPFLQVALIIILFICLIIIGYYWWANSIYQRKLKAEETVEILNTPIEELVDQSLQDLENKYTDKWGEM